MVLECARCKAAIWDDEAYSCDQCGEYVCINCLAVPGSDNSESVCVDCPATYGQTRAERIASGHMTPEDASWRAGQAEERKEGGA